MADTESIHPSPFSGDEIPPSRYPRSRSQRGGGIVEEVAVLLKHAREEKGVSLKEAERATHIPGHYLQILEGEGDPRLLADVLYLVPFLRTYSLFLGLNPAMTVTQFIGAMQTGDTPVALPSFQPSRSFPRIVVGLLILAGLAALSLLWISGEWG